MPMLSLCSPFPEAEISKAYRWHQGTHALCGQWPQGDFVAWLRQAIQHGFTWGVQMGWQTVGLIVIEPSTLPGTPTGEIRDAYVHICLARKAWGQTVFQKVAEPVLGWVFKEVPSLLRLSAWTLASNAPACRVAEDLGFVEEGVMRDAAILGGRTQDLVLYGLTRRDFENGRRTKDHHNIDQHL